MSATPPDAPVPAPEPARAPPANAAPTPQGPQGPQGPHGPIDLALVTARGRARRALGSATDSLATWVMGRALFEITCIGLALLWDRGRVPVPLLALTAVIRAGFDVRAAQLAWRAVPMARALRSDLQVMAAGTFFVTAALIALVPRFDVVPAGISEQAWDAFMGFGEVVLAATALGALTDFTRRVARREGLALTAVALGWALLALVPVPLAAIGAVEPALGPTPWLGLGAALVVAWGFVLAKHLRWERALAVTLVIVAAGRLTTLGADPRPLIAAGAALVLALGAWAIREPLFDLAPHLRAPEIAGPSRSTIRRLFEGPDATTSRAGANSTRGARPSNAASGPDESLMLAYRELGIDPVRGRATRPDKVPRTLPPLPENMTPLVPVNRAEGRPAASDESAAEAPRAPLLDPSEPANAAAWAGAERGLRLLQAGVLARALVVIFGFLLGHGPLGSEPNFWLALGLVAVVTTVPQVLGMQRLGQLPAAARARAAARVGVAIAVALTASDVALAFTWQPLTAIVDAVLSTAIVLALLATLRRLFADVAYTPGRARVFTATWLFGSTVLLTAAVVIVGQFAPGDMQWLAGPLGIASSLTTIATWISLLWLLHDAGIGIGDLRTRVLRAREPLPEAEPAAPPEN